MYDAKGASAFLTNLIWIDAPQQRLSNRIDAQGDY
jgi:hypothetical protein